jgi:hypothetical protein
MKLKSGEDIDRVVIVSAVIILSLVLLTFGAARGFDAYSATQFSRWFVRKTDLGQCGLPFAQNVIGATMFAAVAAVIHLGALIRCWAVARPWEGKYARGTFWWCLFFGTSYFFMIFVARQEGGWISNGARLPPGPNLATACQLSHFWNGAESIFLPGFMMTMLTALITWLTLVWAVVFPKVMANERPLP